MRIGLGLSVTSAVFTSAGLCLQKLYISKSKTDPKAAVDYYHKYYIAGVGYVALGVMLKAAIYLLLPQIAIALLSAQTVVYTVIFEHFSLDVPIGNVTFVCALFILFGIALGAHGIDMFDTNYSYAQLWSLFISLSGLAFSFVCVAVPAMMAYYEHMLQSSTSASGTSVSSTLELIHYARMVFTAAAIAGACGALAKACCEGAFFYYMSLSRHSEGYTDTAIWGFFVFIPITGILTFISFELSPGCC